jgi:hypothetical protein
MNKQPETETTFSSFPWPLCIYLCEPGSYARQTTSTIRLRLHVENVFLAPLPVSTFSFFFEEIGFATLMLHLPYFAACLKQNMPDVSLATVFLVLMISNLENIHLLSHECLCKLEIAPLNKPV